MKPVHEHFGWKTTDLTEGHVNRIEAADGSAKIIAFTPKAWVKDDKPMTVHDVNGKKIDVYQYTVTEWHETLLATILTPD